PDRLVIDMYGINIEDDIAIPERGSFINDIRVSQFSRDPLVARAVLELPFYPGHSVKYREENNSLDLTIPTSRLGGRVVVIDPGHGGVDPGAIGTNGLLEKDVNLAVAEELRRLLIQAGTRVYMTREDDSYPSFPRRVGLANDREADIFVSIHCNSFTEDIPEGTETYVARSSNGNSHLLAELVQSELAGELRLLDRGVKPANFYVLLNTKMPAILVELAFISNPQEEALLKKAQFLDSAAAAIYRGINRYFSRQQ
ncbi:MAG: N-acetylmuramoyl-L-alanine amidase, partial [Halanaerobium sp.]|nr:N-acetylmuramoyl-L-alanine amidase [Halanaerobium sp.]